MPGKQVLRGATSVGAHYHAAHRARSAAEFISKIEGGLQGLGETIYWLELNADSGITAARRLSARRQEAEALIALLASSVKTAKLRS